MSSNRRVFGVDYQFLSCGDVFTQGLAHAAADMGMPYAHADWSVSDLLAQVKAFEPDVLLVVHGRRFCSGHRPEAFAPQTAVWLLDEPYEVDDTASRSHLFDHVFVNDRATLDRHPHASYLPVCYDPHVHFADESPRWRRVGFIGGGNPTRDRYLAALASADLLDYVIGGTWSDPLVNHRCLAHNISPDMTASLYRQTRIILNVFREVHHFNREGIAATAMNPRIYEALACGSLVVSEWRPEIAELVPELPTFTAEDECVELIRTLLADPAHAETIRLACADRLQAHIYANRLQTVLSRIGLEVAA